MTIKNILFTALLVLIALPISASAQSYGGYYNSPQGFFFPYGTGIGAPREVMTVHAWGPTQAPSYHSMNAPQYSQPMYFPQQQYPTYQQPMYQQHQPTYYQPQYSYAPQNYYMPQNYARPPQSYSYSPQPTGGTDLWGTPLCSWGADYMGYPCDRDPHQWIFDPYSGSWY